jgi:UrcA family protein
MYSNRRTARRIAAAGLSLAMMLGTTGTAFAAGPRDVTVIANADSHKTLVGYADLDLTGPAGRRMLANRVVNAANRVCNPGSFDSGLSQSEQIGCFQGAITEVRPQIDLAVRRASEIASRGWSDLPVVTLAVGARF